jgi:hypothetical protein
MRTLQELIDVRERAKIDDIDSLRGKYDEKKVNDKAKEAE